MIDEIGGHAPDTAVNSKKLSGKDSSLPIESVPPPLC